MLRATVHCDGDDLCKGSLQVQEALECAEWLLALGKSLPAGWDFAPRVAIHRLWTEPDLHFRDSPSLPGGLQLSEKEHQGWIPLLLVLRRGCSTGWCILLRWEVVFLFSRSGVSDSVTPWTAARQASPSFTISLSLLKLMSIESVMSANLLILCHFILFHSSIFPSTGGFSNEFTLPIRWPKYWSFSISPSNEHPGLISFRMDWFDLLAVQGTLKSLLQHHSSKALILQCSAFFIVQLSHPYMTTGKIIVLTIQTFVGKVMSLLFNVLSRLSQLFFQGVSIF